MTVKLLTEHHLVFVCRSSSESTLVKNTTSLEISCRDSYYILHTGVIKINLLKLLYKSEGSLCASSWKKGISHGIIELLGQFKCGNLNVHIWA